MGKFLGIDLGTQSLKVVLVREDGVLLDEVSVPLSCVAGLPVGHSEQHPEDWRRAMEQALWMLGQRNTLSEVEALGVSGQQHGLVALDQDLQVVRPAMLWNDVRSAAECAAILERIGGPAALAARTGNGLPPGFTAGKVAWLAAHEAQNFGRLRHVLLPHDFLNLQLTGSLSMEAGDASGTGFFDVRRRRFDEVVCDAVAEGLFSMLPPLVEAGRPAGFLRTEVALAHGLRPGIPIASGGGDNMMAAIGCGAVAKGIVVLSLGTSGTVFAWSEQPIVDDQFEIAAFCDSTGGWLPLGCTMNATVATELTRGLFGTSLADFEHKAAAVEAGSDGVLCVPFFTGERSPDLPLASGSFLGLTRSNMTQAHLLRAAAEGATFALARLCDRLEDLDVPVDQIRLTGGGSNSPLWCSIVASVLGRPVRTGMPAHAAAHGAALQAAWTLQKLQVPGLPIGAVVEQFRLEQGHRLVEPDARAQSVYARRRKVHDDVVAALTPHFEGLRQEGLQEPL